MATTGSVARARLPAPDQRCHLAAADRDPDHGRQALPWLPRSTAIDEAIGNVALVWHGEGVAHQ